MTIVEREFEHWTSRDVSDRGMTRIKNMVDVLLFSDAVELGFCHHVDARSSICLRFMCSI